jgi:Ni,Fe-hydrogenase maturation factor
LGRQVGLALPADDQILLVGIEAEDILTFGEDCTPAVAEAIPKAVEVVLELRGPKTLPAGTSLPRD